MRIIHNTPTQAANDDARYAFHVIKNPEILVQHQGPDLGNSSGQSDQMSATYFRDADNPLRTNHDLLVIGAAIIQDSNSWPANTADFGTSSLAYLGTNIRWSSADYEISAFYIRNQATPNQPIREYIQWIQLEDESESAFTGAAITQPKLQYKISSS